MPEDHLVSRGYQNNFAAMPSKTVVLFDAHSGAMIDPKRPTLRNWAITDFNSFVGDDGELVADLEGQWAKLEAKVLDQIRRVRIDNFDPTLEAAVMNLLAIHLVRSEPYLEAHRRAAEQILDEVPRQIENRPDAVAAFERDIGRPPFPGELADLTRWVGEAREESKESFIESMARMHNRLGEMMAPWRVQVIESEPGLPGFVLPDVPVVHYNRARNAYGFRDQLALGDSDIIGAPLTRHTAVFLTAKRPRHKSLTTKKVVHLVNALFWRSAIREVACHPDDEREALRVFQHLRDLPPDRLKDWS